MQLHDFQTCRTSESRQSYFFAQFIGLLFRAHAAAEAGKVFVVFVFARPFPASRGKTSPPTGEALFPPPADDCLVPGLDDPNTAVRCEPFPGSESPCSLPEYATVRTALSARPSGAPDWVGFQDLYVSTRDIFDARGVRRSAVYRWKPGRNVMSAKRKPSDWRRERRIIRRWDCGMTSWGAELGPRSDSVQTCL